MVYTPFLKLIFTPTPGRGSYEVTEPG